MPTQLTVLRRIGPLRACCSESAVCELCACRLSVRWRWWWYRPSQINESEFIYLWIIDWLWLQGRRPGLQMHRQPDRELESFIWLCDAIEVVRGTRKRGDWEILRVIVPPSVRPYSIVSYEFNIFRDAQGVETSDGMYDLYKWMGDLLLLFINSTPWMMNVKRTHLSLWRADFGMQNLFLHAQRIVKGSSATFQMHNIWFLFNKNNAWSSKFKKIISHFWLFQFPFVDVIQFTRAEHMER